MAAINPDTESSVFAGDAYIPPCEHPDHGTGDQYHKDGNPYYVRFSVSPCGYQHGPDGIVVVCAEWVRTIQGFFCGDCTRSHDIHHVMTVLGPVSDYR